MTRPVKQDCVSSVALACDHTFAYFSITVTPEETIRAHVALCDEVLSMIMEENRILRSTGAVPDLTFVERKRALLPRLDESLERLRILREGGLSLGGATGRQIETAQNKLMKIFMIDRENEQLLLKVSMPVARMGAMPVIRKADPDKVRRTYGN